MTKPDLAAIIAEATKQNNSSGFSCSCPGLGGCDDFMQNRPCKSNVILLSAASASLTPAEGEIAKLIKEFELADSPYNHKWVEWLCGNWRRLLNGLTAEHQRANEAEKVIFEVRARAGRGGEVAVPTCVKTLQELALSLAPLSESETDRKLIPIFVRAVDAYFESQKEGR